MTCPIGGASFTYAPEASRPAFGTRPDGKPYGTGAFPGPLPECPDNGLVLYKDYSAAEVAKLEPIVAAADYQALRASDTQYYRAYSLMKALGESPEDYLWALLQASWEAVGKPDLRARYLAELADESGKVPAAPADINWIGMEGRAINALRELGRFDEALARLDKVPLTGLDVQVPAGPVTEPAVLAARQKRIWLAFFKAVRPVIERKDAQMEPFDLIPRTVAVQRCVEGGDSLAGDARAFCDRESAAVAAARAEKARLAKEMDALRRSREASGR
jgi:hypothetical protein